LIAGDIDAAFVVTGWESPVIQSLLNAKGVEADSYLHADALIAIYPFLHKLVLPAGVVDLSTDRPPAVAHAEDYVRHLAVGSKPSLRPKSPENGNILNIGWRLSADSRVGCSFSESGDISQNARKPVFCGLSVT
jgi:hypothetical protein